MRGADLVVGALAEAGVRTVFTLSGNQIMPVFDACIDADIRLVHVRHEAAAVYMADAWAQVTGEVGVALVTAAPGFANALSPLYSARAAESPVILLSGDSPLSQDGRAAFQEMAQCDVTAPLTKAALRGTTTERLGHDIAEAVRIARSGRPGPVHLALPFDLLNGQAAEDSLPGPESFERQVTPADSADMQTIVAALTDAQRPIVLTGPMLNASRADALLDRLADALDTPVIAMESPRGLRDPALGAFAEVLATADVIVSLGKSIDFTLGFAQPPAVDASCRVFVVDPDLELLDRARRALGGRLAVAIRADADSAAGALVAVAKAGDSDRSAWRAEVAEAVAFRGVYPAVAPDSDRMPPWQLCGVVQDVLDAADDPILISDGGEFGQWAQACLSSRTRVINGPGGAIGGGLCYAIAAKLARPQATVVAMMGDGTAGFHFTEFDTALRAVAPIITVIGNDARWNAEHVIQMRDYGEQRLIGCDLRQTRYDRAAAGLGCHGEHVVDAAGLGPALARAVESGLPACINTEIDGIPAPTFARAGVVPDGGH